MPRSKRIIEHGTPHHITQRGNYKQQVFEDEKDYSIYLNIFEQYRKEYNLSIVAYCLMPNHVHFIAIPLDGASLAQTFKLSHMRYSQYFNNKHCAKGQLWQGRYYSCVLDEKHFQAAVRYVENNPVRASLAKKAQEWQWSSARAHLGINQGLISLKDISDLFSVQKWETYLDEDEDKETIDIIRKYTKTGKSLKTR